MPRPRQKTIQETFEKTCQKCNKKLALKYYYQHREWKAEFFSDIWCKTCVRQFCVDLDTLKEYCRVNKRAYSDALIEKNGIATKLYMESDADYNDTRSETKRKDMFWKRFIKLYYKQMNINAFYGFIYDSELDKYSKNSEYEYVNEVYDDTEVYSDVNTEHLNSSDDNSNPNYIKELDSSNSAKRVKKTYSKSWSGYYTQMELDYMEEYFSGLQRDFKLENIAYIDYAKKVCKASMVMDKAFSDMCNGKLGSEKKYKDFKDIFDQLSQSAKFAEKTRTENDVTGFGSLGEITKKLENEGFLQRKITFEEDDIDAIAKDFRWTLNSIGEEL